MQTAAPYYAGSKGGGTVSSINRLKGKTEQVKGKFEQAVGTATRSNETLIRGHIDEAKSRTREMIADVQDAVDRQSDDAQKEIHEIEGRARSAIARMNRTSLGLLVGAALVLVGLIGALIKSQAAGAPLLAPREYGADPIGLGRTSAEQARATALRLEDRVADQLDRLASQLTGTKASRGLDALTGAMAPILAIVGFSSASHSAIGLRRRRV
jgi:uncharacterized protein YjbJ (UPF0337 family)